MERRTILKLFITVIVLTSVFLLYWVLSHLPRNLLGSGESVAGTGLLIAVVLGVSASFWVVFRDERKKNSKRGSLIVALSGGSAVFYLLGVSETWGVHPPSSSPPIIPNFLFVISPILALSAVLAVILILDEHFAEADLKDETDEHRLRACTCASSTMRLRLKVCCVRLLL